MIKKKTIRILDEVNFSNYISKKTDLNKIKSAARKVLISMETKPKDYRLHVDNVHKFMGALWTKYDCKDIYEILDDLTCLEPALLDIERDPESGRIYRDHYVHLFHVFIDGFRIISAIVNKLSVKEARKIFKIQDESLQSRIKGYDKDGSPTEFKDYTWKERLFYIWSIISTLHDIAIPLTHLEKICNALNTFSKHFHLEISGPFLAPSFPSDLDNYLDLLSRIFQGKLQPGKEEDWRYDKKISNSYVKGYLERLFLEKNHGVLGGFLVYKKIEEIFLCGRSKCSLSPDSFLKYKEIILEEDIARAALAISLHDLGTSETFGVKDTINNDKFKKPKFMPIRFNDYPLTFLLILADSLQECLRWEGKSIRGNSKLQDFPEIRLEIDDDKHIKVEYNLFLSDDSEEQHYFCNAVKDLYDKKKVSPSGSTITDAANDLTRYLEAEITQKLFLNDYLSLSLSFYEGDKKHLLCKQPFKTKRIDR